jgi:hypothetical protein
VQCSAVHCALHSVQCRQCELRPYRRLGQARQHRLQRRAGDDPAFSEPQPEARMVQIQAAEGVKPREVGEQLLPGPGPGPRLRPASSRRSAAGGSFGNGPSAGIHISNVQYFIFSAFYLIFDTIIDSCTETDILLDCKLYFPAVFSWCCSPSSSRC